VIDSDALTPVQQHGSLLFKRDDLYEPFADVPLNGGKVRQAMLLLSHAREQIVQQHGGVVLTATGVHSPQGLIIARVCRELDLRCVIFVGATTVGGALARHAMLRHAVIAGASIDARARVAYEPALMRAAQRWRAEHDGAGYVVRFGINLEDDPDAIIGSTAEQVSNVPSSVRSIVVPTGAGITAAGVIVGVKRCDLDARVVVVQIAGYDRRELIDRIVDGAEYEYVALVGHAYSRQLRRSVGNTITLDPIYEAKAYEWCRTHCDDGTLFWIVGDSTRVRVHETPSRARMTLVA